MKVIILKKNVFAEGSEIITMFTREHGKIRGVAKSVKSIKSKLAFGLQQLYCSDVELAKGRRNYSITGVRALNPFKRIRSDVKLINYALYATELVLKSTPDEQPNEALFDEYLSFLEHLDNAPSGRHPCVHFFVFRALRHAGYGIAAAACASCAAPVTGGSAIRFSNRKGGFVCASCAAKISDAQELSEGLAQSISKLYKQGFAAQDAVPESLEPSLHRVADSFASYILERDLKAGRFIV